VAAVILSTTEEDDDDNSKKGSVVTAKEFCDDWSTYSGNFRSYDDGDEVVIRDEISDILYVSDSPQYGEVSWTIITFDSTSYYIDEFLNGDIPTEELWGMTIFSGDLTGDYRVGDMVDVEIVVVDYEIEGDLTEIPDWYVGIMDAYKGTIEYSEINFPSSYKISHSP
jgi:hypothetical protein